MTRFAFVVVAGLLALLPAPALAGTRDKIIKDCADDGVLQGTYTPSQLRDARQNLPSDIAEYTDCGDVLRRAELPDRGGSGTTAGGGGIDAAAGGGGSGLIVPSTDADRQALALASTAGGKPLEINGQTVVPGASGLGPGAPRNDIPTPLLVALILLTLAGVALSVPALRRLVPLIGRRGL